MGNCSPRAEKARWTAEPDPRLFSYSFKTKLAVCPNPLFLRIGHSQDRCTLNYQTGVGKTNRQTKAFPSLPTSSQQPRRLFTRVSQALWLYWGGGRHRGAYQIKSNHPLTNLNDLGLMSHLSIEQLDSRSLAWKVTITHPSEGPFLSSAQDGDIQESAGLLMSASVCK